MHAIHLNGELETVENLNKFVKPGSEAKEMCSIEKSWSKTFLLTNSSFGTLIMSVFIQRC